VAVELYLKAERAFGQYIFASHICAWLATGFLKLTLRRSPRVAKQVVQLQASECTASEAREEQRNCCTAYKYPTLTSLMGYDCHFRKRGVTDLEALPSSVL
jgi:hypothetical protein